MMLSLFQKKHHPTVLIFRNQPATLDPVRRNRVGLCWRATRQGIAEPGRVNGPLRPGGLHRRGLFFREFRDLSG